MRGDRFLWGILLGVIVLVVVAFAIVMRQPEPGYVSDETPEGVVQNYLLAIQREDFERAWGYLSPTLEGYPASVEQLALDVREQPWQFGGDGEDLAIRSVTPNPIGTDVVLVDVKASSFSPEGPLGGQQSDRDLQFRLRREAAGWRLAHGEGYWYYCWERTKDCPARKDEALPAPPTEP